MFPIPYSSHEGKDWTVARLKELAPKTILDVGAGSGTYVNLLRPYFPDTHFTGNEIFARYVTQFGLAGLYDEVIVGDVRELELPEVDVIIFGDVLEHMEIHEAQDVWRRARSVVRQAVVVSLPIVPYPQGPVDGNDHEAHVADWSDELVRAYLLGITRSWTGVEIGVYIAGPDTSIA